MPLWMQFIVNPTKHWLRETFLKKRELYSKQHIYSYAQFFSRLLRKKTTYHFNSNYVKCNGENNKKMREIFQNIIM